MKVKITNHPSHYSCYALAELICFWAKDEVDKYGFSHAPQWVHNFGEWLTYGSIKPEPEVGDVYELKDDRKLTWLARLIYKLNDFNTRTEHVHIDRWDAYSADYTMGLVILPILKEVSKRKQGAPFVDNEDVPEHLKMSDADHESYKNEGSVDDNFFERWNYVIGEMIFAFETIAGNDMDWEEKFYDESSKSTIKFKKLEDGSSQMIREGESNFDREGMEKYNERITNGLRLFGKYYRSLWT